MSELQAKVALITGAGRGQGRAHAVTLARVGYDVVAFDVPGALTNLPYEMASAADLEKTCAMVQEVGRRAIGVTGDVRNTADLDAAVRTAREELGGLDVVIANAGICNFAPFEQITDVQWDEMQAVNLGGVFRTFRAALPSLRAQGSGRLIATASMAARGGAPNIAHYAAAKAGVVSLVKTLALELGSDGVTVNAICPLTTDTLMIQNEQTYRLFAPDIADPDRDSVRPRFEAMNPMRVAWLDPQEIADVAAFLVSDAGRHISGAVFEVSAGRSGNQI
jgi:SDR family mycofactocin-dependent oxidoreductase